MFRTRKVFLLSLIVLMILAFAGSTFAQEPMVQIGEHPTLGKILTDGNGMSLYLFTKDEADISNCYDGCSQTWPPLLVVDGQTPVAGDGLVGELGVTTRTDGTNQVTYNGMPLYYFAKDTQAGDANGQNIKNIWYVVHPTISDMTISNPIVNLTENAELGPILTNQGMTLYHFTKDTENVSNCMGDCLAKWPPLLVSEGTPVAGDGLTGELGLIERADGGKQVTYNGHPLYFWMKDTKPGDTNGQGVKEVWFVVNPDNAMQIGASTPTQLPTTGGERVPWEIFLLVGLGLIAFVSGSIVFARSK